ncbi:MAG: hypothetical protein ABRQ38_01305 [Candidatus Eremiobacterota bacterium]
MKISSTVIRDLNRKQITLPDEKGDSPLDSVHISSKEEICNDDFNNFLSKGLKKITDYAKPRPTTSADTLEASAKTAAFSGGLTGMFSGGHPVAAVGGAVGGAVGIKVGEKTESPGKAIAAAFTAGALANTAAITAFMAIEAALNGVSASMSPSGLILTAITGGLSGVSGTMQGSCMGDVKDGSSAGMLAGSSMSAFGGSPLLAISGALSGAAGGMLENKAGKYLTSAGVGAVTGAACGAIGGPVAMAVNGILGAITGILATAVGPKFGQIQRNVMEDVQKFFTKIFRPLTKNLGIKGKTAVGALGGAISSIPMALLFSAIAGPPGAALAVLSGAAATGFKVNKILKEREKIEAYSGTVKEFFNKTLPKEQAETIPDEVIKGFSAMFTQKYKDTEAFKHISSEEFIKNIGEFEEQAKNAVSQ